MKKQIKFAMAVAAIAVAGGVGFYASQSEKPMSDVALANIEALADNESGGGNIYDCCNDRSICTGDYCGKFSPAGSTTIYDVYHRH